MQKTNTMVFRSPNSKGKVAFFETPLDESSISGARVNYAPGRESVNSRKKIMVQHANTLALSQNVRSQIALGKSNSKKQINPLEFVPKKYVTKDLKENDIIQLKQVFDYYDSEQASMLSPNDLKTLLSSNGFNPTKETLYGQYQIFIEEIFSELDEEELGGITFEQFLKVLNPEKFKSEKKDTIRRVYRKYDKQNKGYITLDDLRTVVFKDLQEEIDEDVLAEIFKKTDSNQDGKMSFEDFYNVMTKKIYY